MRFGLWEIFRWQCAIGLMLVWLRLEHWESFFVILVGFGVPSFIDQRWKEKHSVRVIALRFGLALSAALLGSRHYGIAYAPVYLLCAASFLAGFALLLYRGKT